VTIHRKVEEQPPFVDIPAKCPPEWMLSDNTSCERIGPLVVPYMKSRHEFHNLPCGIPRDDCPCAMVLGPGLADSQ